MTNDQHALLRALSRILSNKSGSPDLYTPITQLANLYEAAAEQSDLIFRLRREIAARDRDNGRKKLLERARKAEARAKKAESKLRKILASQSWRMTEPYRQLGKVLGLNSPAKAPSGGGAQHAKKASEDKYNGEACGKTSPLSGAPDLRRILVADYRVPRPDFSAGERATAGMLSDLCNVGYEVTFLPGRFSTPEEHEMHPTQDGFNVVDASCGFSTPEDFLAANASQFRVFYLIRDTVANRLMPVIREHNPEARIIFHAPDLRFLRGLREAALLDSDSALITALKIQRAEMAAMKEADHIAVVSPIEADAVQESLPDKNVSIFPVLYAPVSLNPPPFQDRRNVFFVGGFGHRPNAHAVTWFAAKVWPKIREALPSVEFHIIGSEPTEEVLKLTEVPGIKVLGFVHDLTEVMKTFRLGVAPLLYGAGIKGKLAMTMGSSIPCVCTSIAAEGMGVQNGIHALVEDDPQLFADSVISLYTNEDLWGEISRNGLELVVSKYSPHANRADLLKVLHEADCLPLTLLCSRYRSAALSLPKLSAHTQSPDVSVIIAAHGQWDLACSCLASIVEMTANSALTYEVIIADLDSKAQSQASRLSPKLKFTHGSEGRAAAVDWNQAAEQAGGRCLLFIDAHCLALPQLLPKLLAAMDRNESAAMVGPRVVTTTGAVANMGDIFHCDGEITPVQECFDPIPSNSDYDPTIGEYRYLREVDGLTSDCVAIRRSLWQSAGGFDESLGKKYAIADMAMTARLRGMSVLCDSTAEVIRCDSFANDGVCSAPTVDLKQDAARFLGKWKRQLDSDHMPASEPLHRNLVRAERRRLHLSTGTEKTAGANILYFSPFPSHPGNHGNQATIKQFAKTFKALGHKVHFVLLESNLYDDQDEQDMRDTWDSLTILPFPAYPRSDQTENISFDAWYPAGLGDAIRTICAQQSIDIVFCSYVFHSKLLEYVPKNISKIIDTHDQMGNRFDMLRANNLPLEFFSCSPDDEGRYLRRADVVIARRQEEADYFDSVAKTPRCMVVPHFQEPCYVERSYSTLRNIGIVASANIINLGMLQALFEKLAMQFAGAASRWPFTLHVAGRVKDLALALPPEDQVYFRHPSIRLRGYTPDISQFYRDMDLILSPVSIGTGINVKTVEALAFGMPLIATKFGSKGIATVEPMHNHESLEDLVETLAGLSRSPGELDRLAAVSRSTYDAFYSAAARALQTIAETSRQPCNAQLH